MKNKLIKDYLLRYKTNIVLIIVFVTIFVCLELAQPFLVGRAIDMSLEGQKQAFIIDVSILIAISLFAVAANFIFEYLSGALSQKVIYRLRKDIYAKYNSIPISKMNEYATGDLLQLEIADIENVSNGIFAIFKTFIDGILTIVITIVLMLTINWVLALLVIILTPLSYLMSRFVAKFSHAHFKKQSALQADVNSLSVESISNIDILMSYNNEAAVIDEFKRRNVELAKEGRVAQFSASWINPSTRLVNNTIYAIIGIVGIILISNSDSSYLISILAVLSLGKLSSFLTYTSQYSKPFNNISSIIGEFEAMKSSLSRIFDFLANDDDVDDGKLEVEGIESIKFDNVTFSYREKQSLINNLSLEIKKGMKIAIVGPTGAGKTTLINLIMRFYDPRGGSILYNGIDGRDIKKSSLRHNFGMVLQETWIFSGTVYDNVRYGRDNVSKDEVVKACRLAHADTFLNTLPQGYDTVINSESLSLGQKQMISIARVILANQDIVLLDEATSNIDTRNEKLINASFDSLMKNRTSIVIAHRLSTIANADIILVVKDGDVVEKGRHADLLEQKGVYYDLYMSQFK